MKKLNKKILIMVVEDEPILSNILEERLKADGFDVIKAYDGDEGLKMSLTEHPDLILLDLVMPKGDGLTMLKKLREDSWGLNADVVILTNIKNSAVVAKGMTYGLFNKKNKYEYIVKTDWSVDAIIAMIKERFNININK